MTTVRTGLAALLLAAAAAPSACARTDAGATKRLDELSARLDQVDKRSQDVDARLKKIEDMIRQATQGPPEPDATAVYSVPIDGDPYEGPEQAKVTIVEGFEFA